MDKHYLPNNERVHKLCTTLCYDSMEKEIIENTINTICL